MNSDPLSSGTAKDELDLIAGLKVGNIASFNKMYSLYKQRLINSLRFAYGGDINDLESSYADACMTLFTKLQNGTEITGKLYNYLYTISKANIIENFRKNVKHQTVKNFNLSEEENRYLGELNKEDDYFSSELDADLWGSDDDDKEAILTALEYALLDISEKCQKILKLKYMEDYSYNEIGETLGLDPDTLRKITTLRCRKDLKAALISKYNF